MTAGVLRRNTTAESNASKRAAPPPLCKQGPPSMNAQPESTWPADTLPPLRSIGEASDSAPYGIQ
eukprot:scaffold11299_cov115-Isochrysis_galbana.AAC.1